MPAYYTVCRRGQERKNADRLDQSNFDLFNAFEPGSLSFVAHFIQSNKTDFIDFLFCRVHEAHTRCPKNEKIASFSTLAKCLVTLKKIQAE